MHFFPTKNAPLVSLDGRVDGHVDLEAAQVVGHVCPQPEALGGQVPAVVWEVGGWLDVLDRCVCVVGWGCFG